MDPKTNKILQQAGKYILVGKLALALEQYLKIHDLEPEDTTIINTIGDLYVRLDEKENALTWYHKLAEKFEYRELHSNAMATYRKILKLSPKNQGAMTLLAQLYDRQEQVQNAKMQYHMLAKLKMSLNEHEEAITILKRVCKLDPGCADSQMTLAQSQELVGDTNEALQSYLASATALVQHGNIMAATQAIENIFRLSPQDKEYVTSFFLLLQRTNLGERGVDYLESLSLNEDPEFQMILCERLLQESSVEAVLKLLQGNIHNCAVLYKPAIKVLKELIARRDLDASLALVENLAEISIHLKDEATLRGLLHSMAELDTSNVRLLETVTRVLIQIGDKERLEGYLKHLAILQLEATRLSDARETLNQMFCLGRSTFYQDLVSVINKAMLGPTAQIMKKTADQVAQALDKGWLEGSEDLSASADMSSGVSELDLGMGIALEEELQFMQESA